MNTSRLQTALLVFLIGFALGVSVFAASRMLVGALLGAEASAAAEDLAARVAAGEAVEAGGPLSIVTRYSYVNAAGETVRSGEFGPEAGASGRTADAQAAAPDAAPADGWLDRATAVLSGLLGLNQPVVGSVTVPVVRDGAALGTLTVEIDQAAKQESLARSFSLIGILTIGLAVLAVIAIALWTRRGSGGAGARKVFAGGASTLDPLTRLPTRESFTCALGNLIDAAAKADQQVGLMIVNLVQFRAVNDIWGHAAGDSVLKIVADRLRPFAPGPGTLARISGDHFALVVTRDATSHSLRHTADSLLDALRAPYEVGGSSILLGANIGAALYPVNADNAEMLFRAADTALSKAKTQGPDSLVFFDTDMKKRMLRRSVLERDLRQAIERGEFVLFYQPQLELASGELRGYEALLRWERPGEGILPPSEFLPVADETGLIRPLGNWVLRKACADAVSWADGGTVAVNFCAAQFRSQDLEAQVREALEASGLPPERLEVEIPETLFLERAPDVMEMLGRIKALGVRVVMDGFGTGYSGLTSLARFPFDKIKIDRSFVNQLTEDANVAAVVASIVGLGRSMTVDVTAEGVETSEQVTLLKAAGCTIVQGFRFGAPQRASEAGAPAAAVPETEQPAAESAA